MNSVALTFERTMEGKAATANHHIAYKRNQEDGVVAIFETIPDSLDTESYKQKVRESVNYLGTIYSGIVVL